MQGSTPQCLHSSKLVSCTRVNFCPPCITSCLYSTVVSCLQEGYTPIVGAFKCGKMSIVEFLAKKQGLADIVAAHPDCLHIAASYNAVGVAKMLIKAGCQQDYRDEDVSEWILLSVVLELVRIVENLRPNLFEITKYCGYVLSLQIAIVVGHHNNVDL